MPNTAPDARRLHVAVGVIYSADGQDILIAQRPAGRSHPAYWEFPGGKIKTHEHSAAALKRELLEEVNIEVIKSTPLLEYDHDYNDNGHRQLRLHAYEVSSWQGEPHPNEGQPIKWVRPAQLLSINMLAGNQQIIYRIVHKRQ